MTVVFIAAIIGLGLGLIALVATVIHFQANSYDRQEAADRVLFDCEVR